MVASTSQYDVPPCPDGEDRYAAGPGVTPTIETQRTEALARVAGMNTSSALFVGERSSDGLASVVAVWPDRVERRWLTMEHDEHDADHPVEVIPVASIIGVSAARSTSLTSKVTLTLRDGDVEFEFWFAQAQAFYMRLVELSGVRVGMARDEPRRTPHGKHRAVAAVLAALS